MFYFSKKFNQNISNFDFNGRSNVDASYMFGSSEAFNTDIVNAKFQQNTNLRGFFDQSVFNQDISDWCLNYVNKPISFGIDESLEPEWYVPCPELQ